MLEDSDTTFRQLSEGQSKGAVSTAEIRQFLKPDETFEEAKQAVEDIRKNAPTMSMLIGE